MPHLFGTASKYSLIEIVVLNFNDKLLLAAETNFCIKMKPHFRATTYMEVVHKTAVDNSEYLCILFDVFSLRAQLQISYATVKHFAN